jgi:hypothetical protein
MNQRILSDREKAKRGEIPTWLENVGEELRKQAFVPSIHARKGNTFKVGFWLGHGLAVLPRRRELLAEGGLESTSSVRDEDAELGMIAKVTAGACHKPASQAVECFRGFTLGLQKGMRCQEFEVPGETQTFTTYMLLVRNEVQVEELRLRGGTTRELADLLLTKMPAGQGRRIRENATLNDAFVRKIQKICQRVGLSMASRGRPRRKSDRH